MSLHVAQQTFATFGTERVKTCASTAGCRAKDRLPERAGRTGEPGSSSADALQVWNVKTVERKLSSPYDIIASVSCEPLKMISKRRRSCGLVLVDSCSCDQKFSFFQLWHESWNNFGVLMIYSSRSFRTGAILCQTTWIIFFKTKARWTCNLQGIFSTMYKSLHIYIQ